MDIKKRVLIVVSLLIMVIVSILTNIGYSIAKKNIEKYVNLELSKVIEIETLKFDHWIEKKKLLLESLVKVLESVPYTKSEYEKYMLKTNEVMKVSNIFAGFYDGNYFDTVGWIPTKNWHPIQRPWFTETIKYNDKTLVKGPIRYTVINDSYIYISRTINRDSKPFGVIVNEVRANEIEEVFQQVKILKNGYISLIHKKNGKIIFHPNKKYIGKTLKDIKLKYLSDTLLAKQKGIVRFSLENQDKIASFKHMNQGPWILVSMVNESEVNEPLKKLLRYFTIIGAIFVFLTLVIIYVVSFIKNKN